MIDVEAYCTTDPQCPTAMQLHRLPDEVDRSGARCLDGSPAAFYFANATDPTQQHSWEIYFEGGGW